MVWAGWLVLFLDVDVEAEVIRERRLAPQAAILPPLIVFSLYL